MGHRATPSCPLYPLGPVTHTSYIHLLIRHTAKHLLIQCVSESADGYHIVSRDYDGRAIICHRKSGAILWTSKFVITDSDRDDQRNCETDPMDSELEFENVIANDAAEMIIRKCGQLTPRLWPHCFPAYAAEIYRKGGSMYTDFGGDKTLISERIPGSCWNDHSEGKVFAVGRECGDLVISTLIID